MKEIFSFIERRKEAYLAELFDFIRCAGVSCSGENMRQAAQHLCGILRRSGAKRVQILPTSGFPVVYAECITDERLPTMLIYGHYDVQSASDLEKWASNPFSPEIRDGRIYGRGAADNKAQLFAHIKGREAYAAVKGNLPVNVKYLFEGEEEIGSPSLRSFVAENCELLRCDVCYYSDGGYHDSGLPILILGVKGSFYAEITLQGCKQETHAMRAPCLPNPAWRMVDLLASVHMPGGRIAIKGFYDAVRPPSAEQRAAARKIPVNSAALKESYGIARFLGKGDGSDYYERLIFEPAVNLCGIQGGYTGPGFRNIIPRSVTARLDVSLVPKQEPADIFSKLRRHLDEKGFADASLQMIGGAFIPARMSLDSAYVKAARQAVLDGFGVEPIIFPGVGGAGPNDVFLTTLGVPTIGIPYANADQNNHSSDENILLDSFWKGIAASAALIGKLAER
ncbi:M20/M25/M40 family metallo-hydrolase [Anaerotruncus sp. AF02-27]|jgi:acetylornithine deacetylase/succinyl-diaminopimelate desuccinylase-like protein|uniref:M20/M25/M40 family metallo-hydrolase n=1 Tax=Anaerotruncus TaxID=244127 RepID=UPI000E4E9E54|nr:MULTISPECIES: M20/M25/M40 family metallo-hydrolase [Anaerotruncus]RGX54929.1 M20/M25/M40 family metallo-hydrolase [Anaerotruncus sp. AF02-27]